MLKVCKFGGSSLSCSEQFRKVSEIIKSDTSRSVIIVSAAGKRHKADKKITDLLYLCHAYMKAGKPCYPIFELVKKRYSEIERGLGVNCKIESLCDKIYAELNENTALSYLVSRGEYLSAILMASYLGYSFIDAADWLCFHSDGTVNHKESEKKLRSFCQNKNVVTPGFYGADGNGEIRLFSRGGSDITGALAANYLNADVYENWTDVNGIYAADPQIIKTPRAVETVSYREVALLSRGKLQVLHESSIRPCKEKSIPIQIRNTNDPAGGYTVIGKKKTDRSKTPVIFSAKKIASEQYELICLVNRLKAGIILLSELKKAKLPFRIHRIIPYLGVSVREKDYPLALKTAYDAVYQKSPLD